MSSRSTPSSTSGDRRGRPGSEDGAAALLVALSTMLVMLLVAMAVGAQARQSLRLARAETDVTQVEELVTGVLNEVAGRAAATAGWPSGCHDSAGGSDCNSFCTPQPTAASGSGYPRVCYQALQRRTVTTARNGNRVQIPVRVVYQISPDSQPQAVYGWVQFEPTPAPGSWRIYYLHRWCTEPNLSLGLCEQGG